jgi:hypothetical protein
MGLDELDPRARRIVRKTDEDEREPALGEGLAPQFTHPHTKPVHRRRGS